ncbi:MAG TPA: multicopper oxidase family protein [Bacillus sp. (in: firmicutes)]|uniref:multicopper oxidase family protein n=1 Tax=Bacillus litorisediminis TaxID=2922713 RepID=UPI001FB03E7A|nr:multicopper oxidase family protein [Bacillus litorisediminis]HWO76933.1 multicopper oxidase family protein [Bacillus sp. (in: firmicutes)]
MKHKWLLLMAVLGIVVVLGACSNSDSMEGMDHDMSKMENDEQMTSEAGDSDTPVSSLATTVASEVITDKEFTIVAQERIHSLNNEETATVWTFNGSVPGPEIRVTEGEKVKVNLRNELPDPVTIHWHGLPVPNNMDGIPGVTMNAVQPRETFTYEFTASVPGTYWYHSHQDGVNQVDKGLYGSFIIEPKEGLDVDRDYTLVLDEWMGQSESMDMENDSDHNMDTMNENDDSSSDMEGMDHSSIGNMEGMDMEGSESDMGHDMSMYNIFTINGKSGDSIEPLQVKEGEKVRIRLVNAGYMSHNIHIHGQGIQVVSTDGQPITNAETFKDQVIPVAPGERFDIEFIADNPGNWWIECHGKMEGTDGMKVQLQYEGYNGDQEDKPNDEVELPVFELVNYGQEEQTQLTLDQEYDVEYTMELDTVMGQGEEKYTINGEIFPDTENIVVQEGDLVKVTMVNNSDSDDHPMHLHGHFFQVLSKNGEPLDNSVIMKDTLNIKPGEEYVVAFKADNAGDWMFHCHDLHHATAGMATLVTYKGFEPDFTPDPSANNKPE